MGEPTFLKRVCLHIDVHLQWADHILPHYQDAKEGFDTIKNLIKLLTHGDNAQQILGLLEQHFFAPMELLVELHNETHTDNALYESNFRKVFALGPGGLDILLDIAETVYKFIRALSYKDKGPLGRDSEKRNHSIIDCLLAHVKRLRQIVPRQKYDPKEVVEFEKALKNLQVSDSIL